MNRVPIRLQLAATFALAMAVVLTIGGFLLYHHLATSLDRTIAQSLRARTADISALVQQADTGLRDSKLKTRGAYGFAQVLGSHGRIFDQTPSLGPQPLLTPAQLAQARQAPLVVGRAVRVPPSESVRLLATPVSAQGRQLVVVVGMPLETRDNALRYGLWPPRR